MGRKRNSQLGLTESTEEEKKTAEKLRERKPKKMRMLGSGWMGLIPKQKLGAMRREQSKEIV